MAKRRPNITHCSQEGKGEKRRHRIKGREDPVELLPDLKLVSCQDFSEYGLEMRLPIPTPLTYPWDVKAGKMADKVPECKCPHNCQ